VCRIPPVLESVYVMCTYLRFADTRATGQHEASLSDTRISLRRECFSEACENRLLPGKVRIRRGDTNVHGIIMIIHSYKPKLDDAIAREIKGKATYLPVVQLSPSSRFRSLTLRDDAMTGAKRVRWGRVQQMESTALLVGRRAATVTRLPVKCGRHSPVS
jgi:hypothetical protein